MNEGLPLVTVLTPVYDGAKYLHECIESVIKQDYTNWEYIIVNNCSTDSTLEIANHYASIDPRIHVVSNREFVNVIENHNIAFGYVPANSKYTKVVSADDWIYSECIRKMVEVGEENPSVGIVGCYAISPVGARHIGLPPERAVFDGKEACRAHLLGGPQILGAPTAFLYRSDVVRSEERFFFENAPSADVSACYKVLLRYDLGFVHQVLAYERVHDEAVSAKQARFRAFTLDKVAFVVEHGRPFLSDEEFDRRSKEVLDEYYYDVLAVAFMNHYDKTFWDYHKARLEQMGVRFDRTRLLRAVIRRIVDLLCNPKFTLEKITKHEKATRLGGN